MDFLLPLLVFMQALGAVVGVVYAVLAELEWMRAVKDGKIDRAERAHLTQIAKGLRFGMMTILVSSLGLVILAYMAHGMQPAETASYWTMILFALLIVALSWALSRKKVSFALGSAAVFAAWWFLATLTLGQIPAMNFGSALAFYAVATGVFSGILYYARTLILSSAQKTTV